MMKSVEITLPEWLPGFLDGRTFFNDDTSKMELAVALARRNIAEGGGPFGAAVFDRADGRLVSVGMNLVVPANNSALHAEMVAIVFAEKLLKSYSLATKGRFELFTSCAPCAMCLGAVLWSGVERLVYAAKADDARAIGFDEGPVFDESYNYLEERGIEVVHGFMRQEGRAVLQAYLAGGGNIYNP